RRGSNRLIIAADGAVRQTGGRHAHGTCKSLFNISTGPALPCRGCQVVVRGAAPGRESLPLRKQGSSRALPHGGHGKATPAPINSGAGSVCPHSCVITRSWTDVHSSLLKAGAIRGASPRAFVLPWPARKQLPAGPRGDVEQALAPLAGSALCHTSLPPEPCRQALPRPWLFEVAGVVQGAGERS